MIQAPPTAQGSRADPPPRRWMSVSRCRWRSCHPPSAFASVSLQPAIGSACAGQLPTVREVASGPARRDRDRGLRLTVRCCCCAGAPTGNGAVVAGCAQHLRALKGAKVAVGGGVGGGVAPSNRGRCGALLRGYLPSMCYSLNPRPGEASGTRGVPGKQFAQRFDHRSSPAAHRRVSTKFTDPKPPPSSSSQSRELRFVEALR